jgi:hypothetical protein
MTSTVGTGGRFGNHFIRNLAVSILAKTHNLKVSYTYTNEINSLGISLFTGSNIHRKYTQLTDSNYMAYLNMQTITTNFTCSAFFQTKDICNLLYSYLRNSITQESIMKSNPFVSRYSKNKDIFVHIRLGDVVQYNPGLEYYNKVLMNLVEKEHGDIYISSDSPTHDICKSLLEKYRAKLVQYNELDTIRFATTCKYLVLSHGSFSAILGYLGFFSEIYYPKYDSKKMWYGDMFSIPGWNEV